MVALRRISVLVLLMLVAVACGHAKNPTTHRIVATPSASPKATATTTPTPTATPGSSSSSATVAVPASGSPTPAPAGGPSLQTVRIKLTKLATFDEPVAMAVRKGDPDFYIVEKSG